MRNSRKGFFFSLSREIVLYYGTTAEHIRSSSWEDAQTVAILAMTANAFREDKEAALASGMKGHLAKPVDINLLYKMIFNAL